jgi:hypothetical protein
MRAYCIRPTDQGKARSGNLTEFSPEAPLPRQFVPLSPDDRARRLAAIRALLADAAPTFRDRISSGESEARP